MKEKLLKTEVVVRCSKQRVPTESYIDWANLAWLQSQPGQVVIALVETEQMRELNHRFRDIDQPTDVLSFPTEPDEHTGLSLSGDIAICEDIVALKAADYHKLFEEKMAHTVIHGVLHLQGYSHEEDENAEQMHSIERSLLSSIDIADPYLI